MRLLIYSILGIAIFSFIVEKALFQKIEHQAITLTESNENLHKKHQQIQERVVKQQTSLMKKNNNPSLQLSKLLGYSVSPMHYQAELNNLKRYCETAKREHMFNRTYSNELDKQYKCEKYSQAKAIIDSLPKQTFGNL